MNCQKARFYLSAYFDEALTKNEAASLEVHIRDCQSCKQNKKLLNQILVSAATLPRIETSADFNLTLMNRIYVEQAAPSDTYLPGEPQSLFTRSLGWVSIVATVCVLTIAVFYLTNGNLHMVNPEQPTMAIASGQPKVITANSRRHELPISAYYDRIGVSGNSSHYRAVVPRQPQSLRLTSAKAESLITAVRLQMNNELSPVSFARGFSENSPFPTSSYNNKSPIFRTAASGH